MSGHKHTLLIDRPDVSNATLVLAHGAGAPMDSPFMGKMAGLLVERGLTVVRFEFAYMAARRLGPKKPPAPRAEMVVPEYRVALETAAIEGPVFIGGKSMGGRIATYLLAELYEAGRIKGGICLGYPFHPTAKPENVRTGHLETLAAPLLIVQGERDPFGTKQEVSGYSLGSGVELCWLPDGDHDFGPRGASGHTRAQNLARAADAVADFVRRHG
ncbi:MAG TPA: alpha/beta hydrolase [Hyphomicrobiaceae bacterium]|nr:alpha/beta hydrolase [Hyphomicrobiaceae bacterium]